MDFTINRENSTQYLNIKHFIESPYLIRLLKTILDLEESLNGKLVSRFPKVAQFIVFLTYCDWLTGWFHILPEKPTECK